MSGINWNLQRCAKNEQIKMYIEKYPAEIVDMFKELRQLIYDSVSLDLVEKMWAKLPSYYTSYT